MWKGIAIASMWAAVAIIGGEVSGLIAIMAMIGTFFVCLSD